MHSTLQSLLSNFQNILPAEHFFFPSKILGTNANITQVKSSAALLEDEGVGEIGDRPLGFPFLSATLKAFLRGLGLNRTQLKTTAVETREPEQCLMQTEDHLRFDV